jgi:hypothetical protein
MPAMSSIIGTISREECYFTINGDPSVGLWRTRVASFLLEKPADPAWDAMWDAQVASLKAIIRLLVGDRDYDGLFFNDDKLKFRWKLYRERVSLTMGLAPELSLISHRENTKVQVCVPKWSVKCNNFINA